MFKIGFPVDTGEEQSAYGIFVQLTKGDKHYCKDGSTSNLRSNSGATFSFERCRHKIQRYKVFEFEIIPSPPNLEDITPENMCDVGYSDAVCCALATYSSRSPQIPIFISCTFASQKKTLGFRNIQLSPVAQTPNGPLSLAVKYAAARKCGVAALFLHEKDAQSLYRTMPCDIIPLSNITKKTLHNRKTLIIVSCQSSDFKNLVKLITTPNYTKIITLCCILSFIIGILVYKMFIYQEQKTYKKTLYFLENISKSDITVDGKLKSSVMIKSDEKLTLMLYSSTINHWYFSLNQDHKLERIIVVGNNHEIHGIPEEIPIKKIPNSVNKENILTKLYMFEKWASAKIVSLKRNGLFILY